MERKLRTDETLANIIASHNLNVKNTILPAKRKKPKTLSDYGDARMRTKVYTHETPYLNDRIKAIKRDYAFKEKFNLHDKINDMIEWLQHEIALSESPTIVGEINIFEEIKRAITAIRISKEIFAASLNTSLMTSRGKLLDELANQRPTVKQINSLKKNYPIFNKIIKSDTCNKTQGISPLHDIENSIESINEDCLDRLIVACDMLIKRNKLTIDNLKIKTNKRNLGGKPNRVGIEEALPTLVKIYKDGTKHTPTISWNEHDSRHKSKFLAFTLEINELLKYIHPNFCLGKESNIGKIIKKTLGKLIRDPA